MKFTPSTEQDIEQLTEWIKADPYHKGCLDPLWWLTGQGLLCYCLQDEKGPTMYVRLDKDGDLLRIHTQFAPQSEVSKIRTAKSLLWAFPKMRDVAKKNNLTGFVFKSISEKLITFMQIAFSFVPIGNDDYQLLFEVNK